MKYSINRKKLYDKTESIEFVFYMDSLNLEQSNLNWVEAYRPLNRAGHRSRHGLWLTSRDPYSLKWGWAWIGDAK